MSNTLSIETAQSTDWKKILKKRFGDFVALTFPHRTRDLFANPVSQPTGVRDRAIMAHLKSRAIALDQQEFFEKLHADFWSGEGGAVFAQNCDHRFEDVFLAKQKVDFEALKKVWSAMQARHIVEFGCCSGLVLDYLTRNLPVVDSAVGIELNAAQVRMNQASDRFDLRVKFEHADGAQWLLGKGQPKSLFVSNGGVLEYFRRERLDQMMQHISINLPGSLVFSVEPVGADHDWARNKGSVPFGDELSFSHNYRDLFESNGFRVAHERRFEFDTWQMVAIIATVRA